MVIWRLIGLALIAGTVSTSAAQRGRGGAPPEALGAGTIERVTGRDRDVRVFLPPRYGSDGARRFPVFYLLADRPLENLRLPEAADRLPPAPGLSEPIVVLLEASSTAGDSEKYVVEELVPYVDGHYRTIAARISRGLSGGST